MVRRGKSSRMSLTVLSPNFAMLRRVVKWLATKRWHVASFPSNTSLRSVSSSVGNGSRRKLALLSGEASKCSKTSRSRFLMLLGMLVCSYSAGENIIRGSVGVPAPGVVPGGGGGMMGLSSRVGGLVVIGLGVGGGFAVVFLPDAGGLEVGGLGSRFLPLPVFRPVVGGGEEARVE